MKRQVRIYFPTFLYPVSEGSPFVADGLIRRFLAENTNVELVWWKGQLGTEAPRGELLTFTRLGGTEESAPENPYFRFLRVGRSVLSAFASPELLFYPTSLIERWSNLPPADLAIYQYGFSWSWLRLGRDSGPREKQRIVFHHNLESSLSLQRGSGLSWPLHYLNYLKMRNHEAQLEHLVDKNWFLSEPDLRDWIYRGGNPSRASLHFPDLFEEDYAEIKNKRRSNTRNPQALTLGFLGRLDFGPNALGLSWILDELCPLLFSRNFKGKIRIVGKNASKHHLKKMSRFSFVQYEGFQSSLDSFWTELDWLLAPHLEGSGVRIKLVESLMYEIPTLTHFKAAERLSPSLRKSPYLHVVEDPSDWVAHLVKSI